MRDPTRAVKPKGAFSINLQAICRICMAVMVPSHRAFNSSP